MILRSSGLKLEESPHVARQAARDQARHDDSPEDGSREHEDSLEFAHCLNLPYSKNSAAQKKSPPAISPGGGKDSLAGVYGFVKGFINFDPA